MSIYNANESGARYTKTRSIISKGYLQMITSDFTPRPYADQLELWRDVVGYEGVYEVSNLGRIKRILASRSTKVGRILTGYIIKDGYLRVSLCKDGKWKGLLIHRIVATAFIQPPPTPLHEVNHINSDRTDNRVINLEWVTRKENVIHSFTEGYNTHAGEKNANATLNWDLVKEIRTLYASGTPQPILAERYGVQRSCISKIVTQRSWKE